MRRFYQALRTISSSMRCIHSTFLLQAILHLSNIESLDIEGSGIIDESNISSNENFSSSAFSKDLCEPLSQYANVSLVEDLEYRKLMGRLVSLLKKNFYNCFVLHSFEVK